MNKIIFLDRDGVINKKMPEDDYVKCWEEFEFIPEALHAIRALTHAGFRIFVVTNQRGIARQLMTEAHLHDIHENMVRVIAERGGKISAIYYCPHEKDEGCVCRKPNIGMFLRAAEDYNFFLHEAYCIGDSASDKEAGERAGCKTFILGEGKTLADILPELLSE